MKLISAKLSLSVCVVSKSSVKVALVVLVIVWRPSWKSSQSHFGAVNGTTWVARGGCGHNNTDRAKRETQWTRAETCSRHETLCPVAGGQVPETAIQRRQDPLSANVDNIGACFSQTLPSSLLFSWLGREQKRPTTSVDPLAQSSLHFGSLFLIFPIST